MIFVANERHVAASRLLSINGPNQGLFAEFQLQSSSKPLIANPTEYHMHIIHCFCETFDSKDVSGLSPDNERSITLNLPIGAHNAIAFRSHF